MDFFFKKNACMIETYLMQNIAAQIHYSLNGRTVTY